MSKYAPLSKHLAGRAGEEWRASFAELEAVLGFALPKAARTGRAWWSNDAPTAQSRAWAAQGWRVGDLDPAAQEVVFRRGAEPPDDAVQPAVLREAAEAASPQTHAARALGATAIITAGVAVLAGLGAVLARGLLRGNRRS